MKKEFFKSRAARLATVVFGLACALAMVLPVSLPAQDIDDVIQELDRDFGVGSNKEDLKRSNVETTNEQNREDIKIEEDRLLQEEQEENSPGANNSPTSLTVSGSMDCTATGGSVIVNVNGSTVCTASNASVPNQPFSFTKTVGSTFTVTANCTLTTFCSWDFTGSVNPTNALCDIIGASTSGPPFTGPLSTATCTVQ